MKVHNRFIKAFGALLIAALLFGAMPASEVKAQTAVVYDAIPATLPPSMASLGFQATQTSEFGDYVHLDGVNRELETVSVTMVTWAYSSTYPEMTDPEGWAHPITLNIYNAIPGTPNQLGSLIATKTETFTIPWRPEPDTVSCTDNKWLAPDDTCQNGYAFNLTFDFSSLDITLPDAVILGVAYNTQSYGETPIGAGGPYNSLNVGAEGSTVVGTDDNVDNVFWDTDTASWYADGGTAGVGVFREDTAWAPYGTIPFQITASPPPPVYVDDDLVCGGNSPCYETITEGIAAVGAGGTVNVYPGMYTENITINKPLSLLGAGRDTTTIQGVAPVTDSGSFNIAASDVIVDGFEIQGVGKKLIRITQAVENVQFLNNRVVGAENTASEGGWALFESNYNLDQTDMVIDNNIFVGDNATTLVYLNPDLINLTFTNNTFTGTMMTGGLVTGFDGLDGTQNILGNTYVVETTYALLEAFGTFDIVSIFDANTWPEGYVPTDNKVAPMSLVYPSTNEINRTNGWAHVNKISADVSAGTITLEFVQPENWTECFEYRTDGDTSQQLPGDNFNPLIPDLYPYYCLSTIGTRVETFSVDQYVEVRKTFGAERSSDFYWTKFELIGEVWVDDDFTSATPGWGVDHFASIQDAIDAADPGATIHVMDGSYNDPGGVLINKEGLNILLQDGVVVKNDSPCFDIQASHTRILGESYAGAKCVPTDGWPGIMINYNPEGDPDPIEDIVIDKIEIDGTGELTDVGIAVSYNITDLQILNNYIHDLDWAPIFFDEPVGGVLDIQGNMFKNNGDTIYVNGNICPEEPINAEYNSWGVYDVTDEIAYHGSCPVDYTPWTHVEVFIESTNPDVDNWKNQVFVGEQITYEVTADLRQVMGADFVLEFPTNLSVASHTVGSVFDQNYLTITGNEIRFEGWQDIVLDAAAVPVADGQGYVLFTVTFNAVSPGRDLPLNFDETTDDFSMSPGYGPSLNIYADELVDATLDVIDRPTLDIDGLEDPFYAGVMSHEITNTICNPTTGGDWSESSAEPDAIGWIRISNVNLADIASLQFLYDGVWHDFSVQDQYGGTAVNQDGADVVARFGNYNFGFDIPLQDPQWCDIDKFRVTFIKPGTHDVTVSIYDMMDTNDIYTDDILLVKTEPVTITVETGAFEGVGTISMQGRTERLGVPVTLLSDWYADSLFYSTNTISDNLRVTTSGGLYTFTTNQPRYLNVTADLGKFIWVDGSSLYEIATLELKGGNAKWVDDNTIDLDDASIVGANYGMLPSDPLYNENADVNFDGKVSIQDLALVGGNYDLTSEVAYAAWSPQADETLPDLTSVSPAEGPVELGANEPFVWIVDAFDEGDNLYELEVDHSMQGSIPEFSVYANEGNPYGTLAEKVEFESIGVYVTYIAADQMWIINFGETITDAFVANGGITFYVVLKDRNGNQFGTMYGTTPENTFVYTITR